MFLGVNMPIMLTFVSYKTKKALRGRGHWLCGCAAVPAGPCVVGRVEPYRLKASLSSFMAASVMPVGSKPIDLASR